MLKTYQFKTHCTGDIQSTKTANIILPGLMTKQGWTPFRVQAKPYSNSNAYLLVDKPLVIPLLQSPLICLPSVIPNGVRWGLKIGKPWCPGHVQLRSHVRPIHAPLRVLYVEFGLSTPSSVGISIGGPKQLGALGPHPFGWAWQTPKKYALPIWVIMPNLIAVGQTVRAYSTHRDPPEKLYPSCPTF